MIVEAEEVDLTVGGVVAEARHVVDLLTVEEEAETTGTITVAEVVAGVVVMTAEAEAAHPLAMAEEEVAADPPLLDPAVPLVGLHPEVVALTQGLQLTLRGLPLLHVTRIEAHKYSSSPLGATAAGTAAAGTATVISFMCFYLVGCLLVCPADLEVGINAAIAVTIVGTLLLDYCCCRIPSQASHSTIRCIEANC